MWRKFRRKKYRCWPIRTANDADSRCFFERKAD